MLDHVDDTASTRQHELDQTRSEVHLPRKILITQWESISFPTCGILASLVTVLNTSVLAVSPLPSLPRHYGSGAVIATVADEYKDDCDDAFLPFEEFEKSPATMPSPPSPRYP